MNYTWNKLSQKHLSRFLLGAITVSLCILFAPDGAVLAATQGAAGNAYGWLTIFMLVVGTVIFVTYLKLMFTVLQESASSYSEVEEEGEHIFYYASPVLGAMAAAIIAALVIWSYGASSVFLYLGPILCLISPVAIIYCMSRDIQAFKATHHVAGLSVEDSIAKSVERQL